MLRRVFGFGAAMRSFRSATSVLSVILNISKISAKAQTLNEEALIRRLCTFRGGEKHDPDLVFDFQGCQ